jgi:hypothetical protein
MSVNSRLMSCAKRTAIARFPSQLGSLDNLGEHRTISHPKIEEHRAPAGKARQPSREAMPAAGPGGRRRPPHAGTITAGGVDVQPS